MERRRLFAALLILLLTLSTPLPRAAADAPPPADGAPPRTWEARRHPDTAAQRLAAPENPVASAREGLAPDALPVVAWTRIAFQSYVYDNWEIEVARPDGSARTRLTANGAADVRPKLDREAQRVAWVSDRDGNNELYSARVDGTDLRRLTNNAANDDDPAWSPDGTRIAFASQRDGDWDIYVMTADGSRVWSLTNLAGDEWGPAWSPDGSQIAFIRAATQQTGDIYTVAAEGGRPRRDAAGLQ